MAHQALSIKAISYAFFHRSILLPFYNVVGHSFFSPLYKQRVAGFTTQVGRLILVCGPFKRVIQLVVRRDQARSCIAVCGAWDLAKGGTDCLNKEDACGPLLPYSRMNLQHAAFSA
jgi:hypothetical protein